MHATKLCQKVIPNGWTWKLVTILAIENEAPEFVKTKSVILVSLNDSSDRKVIGSTTGIGFPIKDTKYNSFFL